MRRAKWGIGAVLVAGAAWLMMNLFNIDLGGSGINPFATIPGENRTEQETEPANPAQADKENATRETLVSTTNPATAIGGDGTVDVRVVDRSYQLQTGTGEAATWTDATLEQVVAAAKRAPGDDVGIRVRVLRGPSSRASTEDALYEALRAAEIEPSEIAIPDKLVE